MKLVRCCSILALTALVAACDTGKGHDINDNPNAGTPQQQYVKLKQRPSFEQIRQQYQQMIAEIQQMTVTDFKLPEWESSKGTPVDTSACGFDFPGVHLPDGQAFSMKGGFSRASIPDDRWAEAVAKVGAIAKKYGFGEGQRFRDSPGDHDARYFDPYAGRLDFGTQLNTVVGISSGCHLTAEAHQRGGPQPGG